MSDRISHHRDWLTRAGQLAPVLMLAVTAACADGPPKSSQPPPSPPAASQPPVAATPAAADPATDPNDTLPPPPPPAIPEELSRKIDEPFTGDHDGMIARRLIRAGVPFNRTFYFVDKGTPRGLSYEYLMLYEEKLNAELKTGHLKVHVVAVPMSVDALLPALRAGKVDIVVAQLTATPTRQQVVDFSTPTRRNVNEVVVTARGVPPVTTLEDLSGRDVFVRPSSSYHESLVALNDKLKASGKPPVNIQAASEHLQDDDLLEMVNAGLLPAIVVDDYLADFWKQVFSDMTVHRDVALRTGGTLAVAIRKNSPKLAASMNGFIDKFGLQTAIGNILQKKYLQSTKFVKNATSDAERKKFQTLIDLFRKYGEKYQFDYLMMAAQSYQESRLDHGARSAVGAIGVMQVMPETGKEQKVGDIRQLEPNVHAGVKYMRFLRNAFFENEPMNDLDKALFTFAAYNAGPGRIRQLRRETAARGLDPNVWFGNVERLASERIGRETVTYVSNIYKYYVAYRLAVQQAERKKAATTSKSRP